MNKLIAIFFACLLIVGLVGCGSTEVADIKVDSPIVEQPSIDPEMEKAMLVNKYKGEVAINDWEPQDKARMIELLGK